MQLSLFVWTSAQATSILDRLIDSVFIYQVANSGDEDENDVDDVSGDYENSSSEDNQSSGSDVSDADDEADDGMKYCIQSPK